MPRIKKKGERFWTLEWTSLLQIRHNGKNKAEHDDFCTAKETQQQNRVLKWEIITKLLKSDQHQEYIMIFNKLTTPKRNRESSS